MPRRRKYEDIRGGGKNPFRKINRGFAKAMTTINPLSNKEVQKFGIDVGQFTNKELLPGVVSVGIPLASTALGAVASTYGGPVAGEMASNMSEKLLKAYIPQQYQSKNKYVQSLADTVGAVAGGEPDPYQLMMLQNQMAGNVMSDISPKYSTKPISQPIQYNPDNPYQDLMLQLLKGYQQPVGKYSSAPLPPDPNSLSDAIYKTSELGPGADSLTITSPPFQQREGSTQGLLGGGIKKKKGKKSKRGTIKQVEVIHRLPYERFSHAKNSSLHQLLDSQRINEQRNLNRNLADMTKYIKDDMDNVKEQLQTLERERNFYKEALGAGVGKFKKGSQEAKDHMAKLRAMKGKKK